MGGVNVNKLADPVQCGFPQSEGYSQELQEIGLCVTEGQEVAHLKSKPCYINDY